MSVTALRRACVPGALLLAIVTAGRADAQTIRPLVSEHRGEAHGRVELVNQGDEPLNVVIEVQGFHVDEAGAVHDVPLATAQVKLSASSLRVPPRQTRYVFYDATSASMPDWFVILARFSGYPRNQFGGVNVQLELPHFVYLLPSQAWREGDIVVRPATIDPVAGTLTLIVENTGTQFGRIDAVDVRGGGQRVSKNGFPLFPKSIRRLEIPWTGTTLPDTVGVRASAFSIERPLVVTPP